MQQNKVNDIVHPFLSLFHMNQLLEQQVSWCKRKILCCTHMREAKESKPLMKLQT